MAHFQTKFLINIKSMKKYKNIIIMILLTFSASQLYSQTDKVVRGKVTDNKGMPLSQVLVIGDEGDVFTSTDKNGEFSIEVLDSDVLLIEKEGYNSKQISKKQILEKGSVSLVKPDFLKGEKDVLQMPFRTLAQTRTTGAVAKVDVKDLETFDSRQGKDAALNGKVAGLFGTSNIWGRGDAVYVIDGVPRPTNYEFYMREVETMTVLKDPLTRSMYGAMADQGVIMVTTRRGKAYKKEINVQMEYGLNNPVDNTIPKYMNAADYMETYNTVFPNTYSATKIEDTRNGVNPALNPDVDLYSKDFIKSQTNSFAFFADASGGNKQGQYYMNLGWQRNEGWFNLGSPDTQDKLNFRSNIDYKLADNFKMRLDAGALFNIRNTPNITDYWDQAATVIPNAYPLAWDPNLITDPVVRDNILANAKLVDGMLLGGNKTFSRNLYGDFMRNGDRVETERNIQLNIGADWDLKSITPGLKAAGQFSVDAYNTLVRSQTSKYIVYNPLVSFSPTGEQLIGVEAVGEDVFASNLAVREAEMVFQRRIGMFGNLTYDRKFKNTDVSLMAVAYSDKLAIQDAAQDYVNLTYGLNGNIMHDNKYLIDFSYAVLGSQKLPSDNKYGLNTSIGLGWIMSEEDFMKDSKVFDYLKLRATAGILNNDNWDNYFLYSTSFLRGGNYTYNNNVNSNNEVNYVNRANNIDWQKREEISIGFDAAMFNKKLWLEGNVFQTRNYDQITELQNSLPLLLGTQTTNFYSNFNADRIRGFELGLKYEKVFSPYSSLTLGSTFIATEREQTKIDEPKYTYDYQYRQGTDPASWWGLKSNGLYGAADFDALGNLLPTLPASGFGKVAPGDIKYVDKNGDGVINNQDFHIVAQNAPDYQYSFYFNLKYKQFELYGVGVGSVGDSNQRTGDYQRVSGNMKYPEHLKQAYSASNPDVNAAYPRLTAAKSLNNTQTSDYWLYKNNVFSMPAMQLTYNFIGKPSSALKMTKVYVRGTDLLRVDPNTVYSDVRVGTEPRTRTVALGTIFKF
jgi:TonB-linked SusC/RagA family outer membrane protein